MTVLACLSTAATSLSHIVFPTLPFVAQHLQVAYNYLDWRQVERLQLVYNYSCQAGSYYKSTLESYYNMTTTPKKEEVIDVEKEQTNTSASTSLPPLRAPRPDHLVDWHDVKNYLIDDFIKAHKNYDYKPASKTMDPYYNTFSELVLPASTDGEGDDSESEEELQSMIQTHRMWHYILLHSTSTKQWYYSATYYTPTNDQGATTWSWRTTATHYAT